MNHYIIVATIFISVTIAEDWTSQCNKCTCTWYDGSKTANCTTANLNTIPDDLSSEIKVIDFSSNHLYELRNNEFASIKLQDVHKLLFRNCYLKKINKYAFAQMRILIRLDLSENDISQLDEETFKDTEKLKYLFLNQNKIKQLQGTIFHSLTSLQTFEISSNQLVFIDPGTFGNGPSLRSLDFSNNRLKYLDSELLFNLKSLININLQSNPWVCDCKLSTFRDQVMDKLFGPTVCNEPARLKNKNWIVLNSSNFACVPEILQLSSENLKHSNVTISCKIRSDPKPRVNWFFNDRLIGQESQQFKYKVVQEKITLGNHFWNNLTIFQYNFRDVGEYRCEAFNEGGKTFQKLSLIDGNDSTSNVIGGISSNSSLINLAIGLSVSILFLLILVAVLICYCIKFRKKSNKKLNALIVDQSAEYSTLPARQEIEKSLITEVNPVVKPPRQYSSPLLDGSMELDIKTNLLDNETSYGADDESRSFDFEQQHRSKYQLFNSVNGCQLPPDLLSFPPRNIQVSPTASSVSMVPDQYNKNNQMQNYALLQSQYDSLNLCRTLPYSFTTRSQSPFVSVASTATCPSGYVTIPRRPRASWSSEPPVISVADPVYDNLGLRTTAAGNSVLSLTRLNSSTSTNETPTRTNKLETRNLPFGAATEQTNMPMIATLPRVHNASRTNPGDNRLKLSSEGTKSKEFETSLSTPITSTPSKVTDLPIAVDNEKPSSSNSKIPPRPPPKPKKRSSAGPLFEDEGEDGTEV